MMLTTRLRISPPHQVESQTNSLITRNNLHSSGRQVRQAPTSCDEIADLVTALEEADSAIARLALVLRIMSTTITKCTTSDNLLKVVLLFL